MIEENTYIKIDIEKDTIYLKEEVYGVVVDMAKLNNVTKATYVSFYQFFHDRFRKYPVVILNDNKHLTILKSLIQGSDAMKSEITKLPNNYIKINMTKYIEGKSLLISDHSRVIPDIRILFKNI